MHLSNFEYNGFSLAQCFHHQVMMTFEMVIVVYNTSA